MIATSLVGSCLAGLALPIQIILGGDVMDKILDHENGTASTALFK